MKSVQSIVGILGGALITALGLWGPGITLASAVTVGGAEIDRATVLEALKDESPELQAEIGDLMDRLEAGDEGARAEVDGVVEQMQNEEPSAESEAPLSEGEPTSAGGEAATTETLSAEAPGAPEAVEVPEVDVESPAADIAAENNAEAPITWCNGEVHPASEPDPGC